MKFDFTDLATYLTWRQAWRVNYAELTQKIRTLKRGRKQFLNHYRRDVTPQGPVRVLIGRDPNPEHGCMGRRLHNIRLQASLEMERLAEAKALSWVLKQARLAQAA